LSGDTRYRLVYTDEVDSKEIRYAALSYCWGASNTVLTTAATEALYLQEIPTAELPQTIRDALEISRELGIPYLWVDAFCICQGDKKDWERESSRMADIYSGSTLTIVASEGKDSSGGFFALPRQDPGRHVFTAVRPDAESKFLLQIEDRGGYEEGKIPRLHDRGWTLQESVLSRRIVQFPQAELQWRCRTEWLTEFGASYEPLSLIYRSPPFLPLSIREYWHAIWWKWVEGYSLRELTVQTDLVPAIIGLIRHYETITRDESVLGLWKSSLAQDLLWMRTGTISESTKTTAKSLNMPTWSWLSCAVEVKFDFFEFQNRRGKIQDHTAAEIKTISWTNEPYFSEIERASLTLTGPVKNIHLEKAVTNKNTNPPYWIVDKEKPDLSENPLNYKCAAQFDDENTDSGQWLCMLLRSRVSSDIKRTSECFLILEPAGDSNIFKRRGIGAIRGEVLEFDLEQLRTITLL
jgi:hypothetical protein